MFSFALRFSQRDGGYIPDKPAKKKKKIKRVYNGLHYKSNLKKSVRCKTNQSTMSELKTTSEAIFEIKPTTEISRGV